jgi:hypothetical protein
MRSSIGRWRGTLRHLEARGGVAIGTWALVAWKHLVPGQCTTTGIGDMHFITGSEP